MFYLNKIVGAIVNPVAAALLLLLVALLVKTVAKMSSWPQAIRHKCFVVAWFFVAMAFVWLYFWSIGGTYKLLGGWLERPYEIHLAEASPCADAIVLLGGGMGSCTNGYPYAEMYQGADRVWHAARLWKAGKAPIILASGCSERYAALPLLRDFGVPEDRIWIEDRSLNTEQNAKFTAEKLGERKTILLVTSAYHMRRSELMFRKYAQGLRVIPCPTDFEARESIMSSNGVSISDFIPSPMMFGANSVVFKEMIGLVGYCLFR